MCVLVNIYYMSSFVESEPSASRTLLSCAFVSFV